MNNLRNLIRNVFLCMIPVLIITFQACNCNHFKPVPNELGRIQFVNGLKMYEIDSITNHFPPSWSDYRLKNSNWTSRYCSSVDDSLSHDFRCFGVYSVELDLSEIDDVINNLSCQYKSDFFDDSIIRIDFWDIKEESSYRQQKFDSTRPPIYNLGNAYFGLGTEQDSSFSKKLGKFIKTEKQRLPTDLEIYIVDAQPGNFWKNKEMAALEPRPVLPKKWKHGYSRGVAVSCSCSRVCWWVMAW